MKLFTPHQLLLMRRERKAVMGQRMIGIWLLSSVLFATFLSIAFSTGSMTYLDEKMNDPFTFWLNVSRSPGSNDIKLKDVSEELMADSLCNHYQYDNAQISFSTSLDLMSKTGSQKIFRIQHYENLENDLVQKILGEDNVINYNNQQLSLDFSLINPHSLGVIVTDDAMSQLGYTKDNYPAFINLYMPSFGADTLGFKVEVGGYTAAPIPLLAVVKRLPMHKSLISSRYMSLQYDDSNVNPFIMNKEKYARRLYFFVPDDVQNFTDVVERCVPDSLRKNPSQTEATQRIQDTYRSWKKGKIAQVCILGLPPLSVINEIEHRILAELSAFGVERIYDYATVGDSESDGQKAKYDGLSIHFTQLDSIRAFEQYVTQHWKKKLQIEMTQVNAKENFNSVSVMANILTVALIGFSIIAIVIFIINMMQSYFQKVKQNLGTFKAFGISTKELIKVYMTIILGIVMFALVIALSLTWGVELLLPMLGCTKEGGAPHLILWNYRTLFAILIITLSTMVSVLLVMKHLLRQTPGDLIYDR